MVRQLSGYADDVRALSAGDLTIVPIETMDFAVALELQRQHGLLTNDSLNLAVAKRLGIKEIVTADTHFDLVQGITIYKPSDLIL
jgi:predicted nucleic acid-binding protein